MPAPEELRQLVIDVSVAGKTGEPMTPALAERVLNALKRLEQLLDEGSYESLTAKSRRQQLDR